jgi:hypothetical protein
VCGIEVDCKYFPSVLIMQHSRLSQRFDKLHSYCLRCRVDWEIITEGTEELSISINVKYITSCMQKHCVCACARAHACVRVCACVRRYLDIIGTPGIRTVIW